MANIASGYVSIKSTDKEFLEDLKNKINDGPFSYGGPVDIMDKDHGVDVGFTGRWSCEDAWVFFEDLMSNADYAFQQALIDSEISGSESEEGDREAKEISKQSGEATITRKDVSDEREWEEEEEREEEEVAIIRDKTEALTAIQNDGSGLRFASDELKADKEVVLAAVSIHGSLIIDACAELKADKEVVMAAVKNDGHALEYASEELKADKEVVMAAVKEVDSDGIALEYASEELKADKEVVMAAIKNDGHALEYASEELKADKKLVMLANSEIGENHFQ